MVLLRISDAAELLGVSDDTVRRWADAGKLPTIRAESGRLAIEGRALAEFVRSRAGDPDERVFRQSVRNHLRGIVTEVRRDGVVAQVNLQCGPFRVVSLMTREAADELGLEPGVIAVAGVKATNVVVEIEDAR
ncbi:MAG: helix-turn-helix transcriptional regulator [Actinobacteria bacterium]|nr:helix-turn-helix transcriptional regulator [Actinomycetota bacterium]